MELITYLNFNGNCEEALRFYEQFLGGRIECLIRYEGTPAATCAGSLDAKKILHGRLRVNGQTLMGSDCPPERYQQPHGFSMNLSVDSPAEAERAYATLSEGGKVGMPLEETFFAERFGMVFDRFGIPWMVNCVKAAQNARQPEESCAAA